MELSYFELEFEVYVTDVQSQAGMPREFKELFMHEVSDELQQLKTRNIFSNSSLYLFLCKEGS